MRQFSNAIKKHMAITFHMHKINLQMLIVYNPAVQWLTSPIHKQNVNFIGRVRTD